MAFRQMFKTVLRRARPAMYMTATMVVHCSEMDKLSTDKKINWEPPDYSKFTHKHIIQKSTVDTVNSVSQALTITYTAVETTSKEYRHSLSRLMGLIKETLAYRVSDEHWDLIVAARSEVQQKKQMVNQLVSYMDYIQKIGVATSEASYMVGMDNLSITLSQRMDDALNNMNREIKQNEMLEMEYNILQEECIKNTNRDKMAEEDDGVDVKMETILPD